MSIAALIASPLLKSALELVLPVVHDVLGGGKTADKVIARIQLKSLEIDGKQIAAQQSVLMKELDGSWMQRNWRPIAMLVFVALLVYHIIIVSLVNAIWGVGTIPLDNVSIVGSVQYEIIQVIKWGMGGYIVGRSVEKTAKTIIERPKAPSEPSVEAAKEDGVRPPKIPTGADVVNVPFMKYD